MELKQMLQNELKRDTREKKTISVVVESEKLEMLDVIIRGFSTLNPEKNFTRQKLFDMAIESLIKEAQGILEENGLLENGFADVENTEVRENVFDTAIFPAWPDGFEEAFLGEKRWYYVRLGHDKIDKIKYVACYVGAPVSAITHYAKVKNIEVVEVEGKQKYIINFEGEPIALENPVPLGDVHATAVRANRYVTLETLKNARSYKDLLG